MTATLRFGRFELRPASRQLLVDGRPVVLGSRAFDVLLALVRRREQVVTKQDLLDLAWPGLIVEENNLQVQISTLRKVLGADTITTIPGRGYQFTAPAIDTAVGHAYPDSGAHASKESRRVEPNRLAPATGPLYGRDADINTACALLDDHTVVSIVGGPGFGKTRLARAVAHRLSTRYRDGVWIVELGALFDTQLVPSTVGRALRISRAEERPKAVVIAAAVRAMNCLIVIDNCEHLIGAVREQVEAITLQAPAIRILITSRAPLRIPGEQLLHLAPLAVPPANMANDALRYGAVQLFCARASAEDSHFVLTEHNSQAVNEICRHLDGIPLALELAAARVRVLGVDGLQTRLHDRLRLLTNGSAHHVKERALGAALEWSHDLLSQPEQTVFRRLAVFSGWFSLKAAEQVAAEEAIDSWSVLDHLGSLIDKSLITVGSGPTPRYRLLETIRIFALEKLANSNELGQIARLHAQATLGILQEIQRRGWTLTGDVLLAELEPELDNLRSALSWASGDGGDKQLGVALIGASTWLWDSLNLGAEARARTLALEPWAGDPTPIEVQAAYWRARTFHFGGLFSADLLFAAVRSVELSRKVGDGSLLYDALTLSSIIASRSGKVDIAEANLLEARMLEAPSWPPRQRAVRYFAEAEYFEAADQLTDARRAQEMRIMLLKQAQELGVQLHACSQAVALDVAIGDVEQAVGRGREALADIATRCPPFRARLLRLNLAHALVVQGRIDNALPLLKEALVQLRGSAGQWMTLDLLAQICIKQGCSALAVELMACADKTYDLRGFVRKPHAARSRDDLTALLARCFSAHELAELRTAGSAMSEDDAIALAMHTISVYGPRS